MIFDIFLNMGAAVVGFLVGLFPVSQGFPPAVFTAAATLGNTIGVLNPLVPIGTLATILGLILTLEGIIFGFKTFQWIYRYIPFIGR